MSLKEQADQLLSAAVADGAVPGVVALATNAEGTYYAGGFGERIQGDGGELTPDTVVWLASMTKAITGAAPTGTGPFGGGRPEWGGLIGWRAQSSECEPWPHRTTDPSQQSLLPSLNRLTRSVHSLGAQKCVGCA